jgi:hypothetical protein
MSRRDERSMASTVGTHQRSHPVYNQDHIGV